MATTSGKKAAKKAAKKAPAKQTGADAALEAFNEAMLAVQNAGQALVEARRRNKKVAQRDDIGLALHNAVEAMKRIKNDVASPPPTTVEH